MSKLDRLAIPLSWVGDITLNQKRVDEANAKYDKLCKVKQGYEKDKQHPVSCTCTEVQGNMNCKFNNW